MSSFDKPLARYAILFALICITCTLLLWHTSYALVQHTPDFWLQGFYPKQAAPNGVHQFSSPHASIFLTNLPAHARMLKLRVQSPQPLPARTLIISSQQVVLARVWVGEQPQTITIALPRAGDTFAGSTLINLDTDGVQVRGDARNLGLVFDNIRVSTGARPIFPWRLLLGVAIGLAAAWVGWLVLRDLRAHKQLAFWLLTAICGSYTYIMSFYSLINYRLFRTNTYDLGIFDQAVWLISRNLTPYSSGEGIHILGDHASLILYPMALLYSIFPDTRALLMAQSLIIALGAVPLFMLGAAQGSRLFGATAAAAYLLHPATHNMNLFDFHPDVVAGTALLFACWAIERKRWRIALVSCVLLLATKENFAISVAWLGCLLIARRVWRFGSLIVVAGSAWFLIATLLVGPAFSSGQTSHGFGRFAQYGTSLPEIAQTLLVNPMIFLNTLLASENQLYLLSLLVPFAFLPLLSLRYLALAAPAVLLNLLSDFPAQHSTLYHYNALIVPCLALAMLSGLFTIESGIRSALTHTQGENYWGNRFRSAASIICCVLVCLALVYTLSTTRLRAREIAGAMHQSLARVYYYEYALSLVPAEANISAQTQLQPHAAHRIQAFLFPNPFRQVVFYDPQGQPYNADVDYIVYDRRRPDNTYMRSSEKLALLDQLEQRFQRVLDLDGVVVLKRKR